MALSQILIPVTIAIFLTFLFHPLMAFLKNKNIPKAVSLILILVVVGIFGFLIVYVLISTIGDFQDKSDTYFENIKSFISEILRPFDVTLREFAAWLKINLRTLSLKTVLPKLYEAGIIQGFLSSFSSVVGDLIVALIFWIFMMLGKVKFEERLAVAMGKRNAMVQNSISNINVQIQSYLVIKTILSIIVAGIATIVFFLFGIDFAILWGVLTFILNFIPNIGAIIATIGPIVIGLLQYGLGFRVIALTVILLAVHNIVGSFIEPHYLGKKMDLSPVFVLFSLIFWGWIWGITGMFLAVPIAAVMKILFSNIGPLKPLAILMGSKTAGGDTTIEESQDDVIKQ